MEDEYVLSSFKDDRHSNNFPITSTLFKGSLNNPSVIGGEKKLHETNFAEAPNFITFEDEDVLFEDSNDIIISDDSEQNHHSPLEDYAMDYFQICRLQGPSFCKKKDNNENHEFLSSSNNFLDFSKDIDQNGIIKFSAENMEKSNNNNNNVDPNYFPENESPIPTIKTLQKAENNCETDFPLSDIMNLYNNTCFQSFSPKGSQRAETIKNNNEAKSSKSHKKKQRIERNKMTKMKEENINSSPPSLKLKKSKSEFHKTKYPITEDLDSLNFYQQIYSKKDQNDCKNTSIANFPSLNSKSLNCRIQTNRKTSFSSKTCPLLKLEDFPNFAKTYSMPPINPATNFLAYDPGESLMFPTEMKDYFCNPSFAMNQNKNLTFKRIGTLSLEERKMKIDRYLQKRKQRSWNKKISYDCRKRVADNRLRIRGRFVTKSHAFEILEADGISYDPNTITLNEIKEYLTKKFGENNKNQEADNFILFDEENFNSQKKEHQEDKEKIYFGLNEDSVTPPFRAFDEKYDFSYS